MSHDESDPLLDELIMRVHAPSAPALPPMPDEPPGMGEPEAEAPADNVVPLRPQRRPWMGALLAAAGLPAARPRGDTRRLPLTPVPEDWTG